MAEAIEGADAVVNFAAETHVDRSIAEPDAFIRTHAMGTLVLLEAAARARHPLRAGLHGRGLRLDRGGLVHRGPRRSRPSSPYSATKAGADLSSASYHHTYGLEALICRGSNNYGPYQSPEKLIPLMVLNALHGDPLPVYGDGMQVRNWIYVEDFARGIGHVLEHGVPGEAYNVGGPDEAANLDVVRRIIELTGASDDLIEYVPDRPGTIAATRSARRSRAARLGPRRSLRRRARAHGRWYRDKRWWWEPIRSGDYRAYYERQYGRARRPARVAGLSSLAAAQTAVTGARPPRLEAPTVSARGAAAGDRTAPVRRAHRPALPSASPPPAVPLAARAAASSPSGPCRSPLPWLLRRTLPLGSGRPGRVRAVGSPPPPPSPPAAPPPPPRPRSPPMQPPLGKPVALACTSPTRPPRPVDGRRPARAPRSRPSIPPVASAARPRPYLATPARRRASRP